MWKLLEAFNQLTLTLLSDLMCEVKIKAVTSRDHLNWGCTIDPHPSAHTHLIQRALLLQPSGAKRGELTVCAALQAAAPHISTPSELQEETGAGFLEEHFGAGDPEDTTTTSTLSFRTHTHKKKRARLDLSCGPLESNCNDTTVTMIVSWNCAPVVSLVNSLLLRHRDPADLQARLVASEMPLSLQWDNVLG